MFHAAAKALSRASQEVATVGKPDPDAPEAEEFATRLGHVLGLDLNVVPIESLFHDDNGPHILKQGTKPTRPAELGRLEIVAHGEHMQKAADDLERAESTTLRSLRAQALAGTFRALSTAAGGDLHDAVARFAFAASDALGRGAAATQTDDFVNGLRSAAAILLAPQSGKEAPLAEDMARIVATFQDMRGASGEVEAVEKTEAPYTRPAAESVAVTPERTTAAPDVRPPGEYLEEANDLVGSWARYQRYVATHGVGEPSLEALLAGPTEASVAAPAQVVLVTSEASSVVTDDVVEVAALQYSGEAAIARANELRDEVRRQLRSESPNSDTIDSLVEELTELVELARLEHT